MRKDINSRFVMIHEIINWKIIGNLSFFLAVSLSLLEVNLRYPYRSIRCHYMSFQTRTMIFFNLYYTGGDLKDNYNNFLVITIGSVVYKLDSTFVLN